jgi:hypothetical protein
VPRLGRLHPRLLLGALAYAEWSRGEPGDHLAFLDRIAVVQFDTHEAAGDRRVSFTVILLIRPLPM